MAEMPPNSFFWHLIFKNFCWGYAHRPLRISTLRVLCTPVCGIHRYISPTSAYRPVKYMLSAADQS